MATKRSSLSSKRSIIIIAAVVIVAIVGLSYAFHVGPFKRPAKPASTASQYTKGQPTTSASSSGSKTNSSSSGSASSNQSPGAQKSNSGSSTSSNVTLVTPTGNFVSDHRPNLSGTPAPNTMSSVCDTTPGATCQITFTMGSTVKSLPVQTVDSGGSTYWNWKLQDYGLTAGTWQIEAIAKLSGQIQTATDPTNLVVSP